ncbi:MAG: response regulator [Planctomycetes bacterium]|nr:response regulator [Planctomycetota bacterium]
MATRVLVVDDAAFMRHMLKNILVEMDCEIVAEAGDGEAAIEAYQTHKPDLVTLDLVMPKMGGLEALEKIRTLDGNAKVVVISAIDQRSSLMQAVKLGAVDYVVKPFDREGVTKAVNRALGTVGSPAQ